MTSYFYVQPTVAVGCRLCRCKKFSDRKEACKHATYDYYTKALTLSLPKCCGTWIRTKIPASREQCPTIRRSRSMLLFSHKNSRKSTRSSNPFRRNRDTKNDPFVRGGGKKCQLIGNKTNGSIRQWFRSSVFYIPYNRTTGSR